MKHFRILTLGLLLLGFVACENKETKTAGMGEKMDRKELMADINKLEETLFNSVNKAMNYKEATEVVKAYRAFINNDPLDPMSPEYMFKMAEVQMGLKQYQKATDNFYNVYKNYPGFDKAVQSLYLSAFVYDEHLNLKGKAKERYELLIEKYPGHKLAEDSKAAIRILTMTDDELLKMLQQKNAEK